VLKLKQKFKVIHPFHPLYQQEFNLLQYRRSWGKTCIDYLDSQGDVGAIPLEWTDVAPLDSFVEISASRAVFHISELLRLKQMVDQLTENECK
jgi:hypothetical protein